MKQRTGIFLFTVVAGLILLGAGCTNNRTVSSTTPTQPATKTMVSSALYNLEIPVPQGFTFKKLNPDYEFILSHNKYADLIFYFESDYSPGEYEDATVTTSEITSKQGIVFKITTNTSKKYATVINYVEAITDAEFAFSVIYDQENAKEKNELVKKVIENLFFERRT